MQLRHNQAKLVLVLCIFYEKADCILSTMLASNETRQNLNCKSLDGLDEYTTEATFVLVASQLGFPQSEAS